jgi:hypothetical protein
MPTRRDAGKSERRLGELTVSAGADPRQDTPVIVPLPPELAGRKLWLRPPAPRGARRLALDVEADGNGVFVLPALGKGQRARFWLVEDAQPEAAAAPGDNTGVSVVQQDDALAFSIDGAPVFRYRMKARPPRAGLSPQAIRGGYIHPVFTPAGVLVTDDYALKHSAHHGIWTAWQSSELGGKKISFWGSQSARLDFRDLQSSYAGRVTGGFLARHAGTELGSQPPRPVLDEEWRVRLYRTHDDEHAPYYVFDLDWTDRVLGNDPLQVLQYQYGGLAVRGHADWDGPTGATFLTSEGKDRLSGEGTNGRWVHLGGPVGGHPVGIAALVHPENFRAPQPLRLHHNEPYFSVAPAKAGPFSIEPGKPFRSRYRFVVADGPADPRLLERLWADYARPPVVAVKLRGAARVDSTQPPPSTAARR